MYPYDPDDPDYLSIYQVGFKGCFQCGQVGHYDRAQCPLKNDRKSLKLFWTELWIHNPHTKNKNNRTQERASVDPTTKDSLISLVTTYWDCFCEEGARRPIIGYEFAINTGSSKPVCCKKPNYVPYESEIIMKQIVSLLKNDWIEKCAGPWGSMIVLAENPHKENITDITKFIWRMCVSYQKN